VRVGITVVAARFLSQRLPTLLADHPGLKVELVVSDRFGDMIEDRLDLALRAGDITGLPEVFDNLRSGELVRVLSDFLAPGLPISLVYPSRRHLAPRTRLVLDFIEKQVRGVRAMFATNIGQSSRTQTRCPFVVPDGAHPSLRFAARLWLEPSKLKTAHPEREVETKLAL
jgi:DNA-binding transcriptional LysR family regulator